MSKMPDHPRVEIEGPQELWDWLEAHHATADGAIVVTYKVSDKGRYTSKEQILDAVVAYGWIDGRRYVVDDARTAQLITPRKTQAWAQSYKDRAEALEAEGRMQPAGRASVMEGRTNGLWDFMADVDRLEVPADLDTALGGARSAWDALAPSYRRNVLRWIKLGKTEATRNKRITAAAVATAAGEKLAQM